MRCHLSRRRGRVSRRCEPNARGPSMEGTKALAQYEQVRAKLADGLSVAAAVKAVSAETGASTGTLQSVYYRVAREKGVTAPRAPRRSSPRSAKAQRANGAPVRRGAGGAASTASLL